MAGVRRLCGFNERVAVSRKSRCQITYPCASACRGMDCFGGWVLAFCGDASFSSGMEEVLLRCPTNPVIAVDCDAMEEPKAFLMSFPGEEATFTACTPFMYLPILLRSSVIR